MRGQMNNKMNCVNIKITMSAIKKLYKNVVSGLSKKSATSGTFFFKMIGCPLILSILLVPVCADAEIINGWEVNLLEPLKYEKELNHTREVQIYTGDFIMQKSQKKPNLGMQFILAHVRVQKKDDLARAFNPNLFVIKTDDKIYERINDDAFLVDFSLKALPHLNMRYGAFEGYLIYEVPVSVTQAVLSYDKLTLKALNN